MLFYSHEFFCVRSVVFRSLQFSLVWFRFCVSVRTFMLCVFIFCCECTWWAFVDSCALWFCYVRVRYRVCSVHMCCVLYSTRFVFIYRPRAFLLSCFVLLLIKAHLYFWVLASPLYLKPDHVVSLFWFPDALIQSSPKTTIFSSFILTSGSQKRTTHTSSQARGREFVSLRIPIAIGLQHWFRPTAVCIH